MGGYSFRHFRNNIAKKYVLNVRAPCRSLTVFSAISFYSLLALQVASLVVGSAKLPSWSLAPVSGLRVTYLVYLILSWSFLGILLIALLVCLYVSTQWCVGMIVYGCYLRRLHDQEVILEKTEKNCCCCCHTYRDRECCSRCGHCCTGYELDPTRQRINNSCCCDGCCSCCIDCCIDCCGERPVILPENISQADIVVMGPHHHVIYMPNPSAPATLSSTPTPVETMAGMTGVGAFQGGRHFV